MVCEVVTGMEDEKDDGSHHQGTHIDAAISNTGMPQ
jgi:hypothetical protein